MTPTFIDRRRCIYMFIDNSEHSKSTTYYAPAVYYEAVFHTRTTRENLVSKQVSVIML